MIITLYNNNSERNELNKVLTNELQIEGTLRGAVDVTRPIISLTTDFSDRNYLYIPNFNRYYYINNFTYERNGLITIHAIVDVLMSFKADINNATGILDTSELEGITNYMRGDKWRDLVKTKTDILNFPNGLLENGEYILITAGG